MTYDFKCEVCEKEVELNIPMDEYSEVKDKQTCDCGGKLTRIQGWQGGVTLCSGMYGIDGKKGWTT